MRCTKYLMIFLRTVVPLNNIRLAGNTYHAFHAMRQQQNQTRLPDPFGLSTSNELVNDTLGSVDKVTELGFPADKRIRVGHGESKFKSNDSVLGERRIAHGVGGLIWVQMGQHIVSSFVDGLMVEDVMPVAETIENQK